MGANRVTATRIVLRQRFVFGAIGVTVGLVLAVLACRLVTSGVVWIVTFNGPNPLLFAAIAVPLLIIAVLATYAPARRASLIHPMKGLRDE